MINNHWIFGNGVHIEHTPVGLTVRPTISNYLCDYPCGSVSFGNGNLNFYTNNIKVYDGQSNQMNNINLSWDKVWNIALFKKPESCDEYILVTPEKYPSWPIDQFSGPRYPFCNEPGDESFTNSIHLTTINYDSNTVSQPIQFSSPFGYRFTEKVLAFRKNIGEGYWIVCLMRKYNPTACNEDDLSTNGLNAEEAIMRIYQYGHNGLSLVQDIKLSNAVLPQGQINIDLNRSKIAFTNGRFNTTTILYIEETYGTTSSPNITYHTANNDSYLEVINEESISIIGPDPDTTPDWYLKRYASWARGCAFSPNGNYLYVTIGSLQNYDPALHDDDNQVQYNKDYVFQVDLNNINSPSRIGIFDFPRLQEDTYGVSHIQNYLNRVYFAVPGRNFLGEIYNPNSQNASADNHAHPLNDICMHGLPCRIS